MTDLLDVRGTSQAALCQVLEDYGRRAAEDPNRIRALLNDVLGTAAESSRACVDALVVAASVGIPAAIREGEAPSGLVARLDEWGLDEDTAGWSVGAWTAALSGVQSVPATALPQTRSPEASAVLLAAPAAALSVTGSASPPTMLPTEAPAEITGTPPAVVDGILAPVPTRGHRQMRPVVAALALAGILLIAAGGAYALTRGTEPSASATPSASSPSPSSAPSSSDDLAAQRAAEEKLRTTVLAVASAAAPATTAQKTAATQAAQAADHLRAVRSAAADSARSRAVRARERIREDLASATAAVAAAQAAITRTAAALTLAQGAAAALPGSPLAEQLLTQARESQQRAVAALAAARSSVTAIKKADSAAKTTIAKIKSKPTPKPDPTPPPKPCGSDCVPPVPPPL